MNKEDVLKMIVNKDPSETMFVFDIDGTLVGNKEIIVNGSKTTIKEFPKDAVETIKELQKRGFKCGFNTGRSLESSDQTKVFDQEIAWDFAICSNGQTIIDSEGNIIQKHLVEQDIVKEVIKRAQEHNIGIIMDTEYGFVSIGNLTEQQKSDLGKTEYIPKDIKDIKECRSFSLVNGGGYNEEEMKKIFGDIPNTKINFSARTYFDIVGEDDSKAKAARTFAEQFGIKNIISFGDEKNDMEMAKDSDYFICMGNGNPVVKDIADYVTDAWNKSGIKKAVDYIFSKMEKVQEMKTEMTFNIRTIFEEKSFADKEKAMLFLNETRNNELEEMVLHIQTTKNNNEIIENEIVFNSLEQCKQKLSKNIDYEYINLVAIKDRDNHDKEKSELFIDKTQSYEGSTMSR